VMQCHLNREVRVVRRLGRGQLVGSNPTRKAVAGVYVT